MLQDCRFGRIEFKVAERALLIDGTPAVLGARAFDVLQALIEHRERVISKDELLEIAWPGLIVEENNVHVQIWALRRLLGQKAIVTVPGVGYQFCLAETVAAHPEGQVVASTRSRIFIALVFGALIAAGGLAAYLNVSHNAGIQSTLPAGVEISAGPLSIAVLPFSNLTGDASQAYIADGLTAGLTTDLSRIRDAFIASAATAFTYKDKPVTAQQVGRELGVRFILQGSVQRSGSRIRVDAQLADTTSGAQLWSESFDGDEADLFALQDSVTTRVGNSIGREMIIAAARESETRGGNPKATDLMLRASALNLTPFSLGKLQQTEDLYRRVLAMEPNHTGAMAGLANSLVLQADSYGYALDGRAVEKKYAEGLAIALTAGQLDPNNPGVYVALMVYAISHDDYAGALRAAETRLSLEPKNPVAYNNLALIFLKGGEPEKSIALETQGIGLDPKHPRDGFLLTMGRAYFMLGDNDAAIEWCLKSLEKNPAYPSAYATLAMAYAYKQDERKSRAAVAELHRLEPAFRLAESQKPGSSTPARYKQYWETRLLPAWHKAGLPE